MAKSHKIKSVIKSTEKTAVITQAMQLVSASKLPKALERLEKNRGFSDLVESMMYQYSDSSDVPYFNPRPDAKSHGIIIIGSDRGLCGSLNLNLFKNTLQTIQGLEKEGKHVFLALCGSKTVQFFSEQPNILTALEHIGDQPSLETMMPLMHPMISGFIENKIDCIHIASNVFESTLSQVPQIKQVLPIPSKIEGIKEDDYLYEPKKTTVVETLFRHYIESVIYRSVIEGIASEQAARMIAMKNATENANEIIQDLNLTYNKIRQALITQEIAEISAGANYTDGESL